MKSAPFTGVFASGSCATRSVTQEPKASLEVVYVITSSVTHVAANKKNRKWPPMLPKAFGRLAENFPMWAAISEDKATLQRILTGFRIEFEEIPDPYCCKLEKPLNTENIKQTVETGLLTNAFMQVPKKFTLGLQPCFEQDESTEYKQKIRSVCPNIPIVVCVNNWNIAPSIISKSIDPEVGHVHISLKSNDNINDPFQYLLRKLVDKNCKINT